MLRHLCFSRFSRLTLVLLVIVTMTGFSTVSALASPGVKLTGTGSMTVAAEGLSTFTLEGSASHLGKYTCYGEVTFVAGENGTLDGTGIAVIEAANGDLIVGVVHWQIDQDGNGSLGFSWRDFVVFSDDTVVSSTGRFSESRPASAISKTKSITDGTSNIIAILIG